MRTFILLSVLLTIFSCKKTEVETYSTSDSSAINQVDYVPLTENEKAFAENNTVQSPPNDIILPTAPTYYNFVVFETITTYTKEKRTFVTGVFESIGQLTEEEKYRQMDKSQSENKASLLSANVTARYLKSYTSYSEASKARENYLGIRSETGYSSDAAAAAAAVTDGEGTLTK